MGTMNEQYLTTEQLSQLLPFSQSYLRQLRVSGDGPSFVKLGKKVVYRVSDLEAWLSRHKSQKSTSQVVR